MKQLKLIFSCEHGGNTIPAAYRSLFKGKDRLLDSHRGYDPGALVMAKYLAENLKAPLISTTVSRLLVDVNRSLWRRTLFSEVTKKLDKKEKQQILDQYYFPYQQKITQAFDNLTGEDVILIHIAVHSFTPALNGVERQTGVGLLYHPARRYEKIFCRLWKEALKKQDRNLRVRFNYPYQGKPDGVAARRRLLTTEDQYIGIELEINQKLVKLNTRSLKQTISQSLDTAMERLADTLHGV